MLLAPLRTRQVQLHYLDIVNYYRARDALRQCLPDSLKDASFANMLRGEEAVQRWLAHLLKNLSDKPDSSMQQGGAALSGMNSGRFAQGVQVPYLGQQSTTWQLNG